MAQEVKVKVREYRMTYVECCGKKYYGKYPNQVKSPAQYSKRVKALVVLYSVRNNLSMGKIVELLNQLYGIDMNEATICNRIKKYSNDLDFQTELIKDLLSKESTHFRSQDGATYFLKIRSFVSTITKQGQDIFEAIIYAMTNPKYKLGFKPG